jgi:hypothetical protein
MTTLAETVIGLFKTEVIHRRGPWRSFDAVERCMGGLVQQPPAIGSNRQHPTCRSGSELLRD